ncbi:MAG: COX15/CtaA family protein [Sterolibacterium sp.]|nr:COX15/CtaA family protein [Sterolibacterium sp.]
MESPSRRDVPAWLLVCCVMVFATLVVGGATRLTHSGLSIVEWQPIVGTLPPLSETDWQSAFAKYQQTPEFRKVNQRMTLVEFKPIFWWEFAHRLLGRSIGMVFLLPFLYFFLQKRIDAKLLLRLSGIFLLGALQGGMGWYMVRSGLVDDPRVSHYRLTAHLGLAFIIFAALFWLALELWTPCRTRSGDRPGLSFLRSCSTWLVSLIFVMALSGSLVAGLHAGLGYNSFPLMHGDFLPPDMFLLEPWFVNFFSNPTAAQFDHRLIAWLLILLLPLFWFRAKATELPSRTRLAVHVLLLVFAAQISLGIATLLLVVPMPLALAHQAGAMLLFAASLWVCHELRCTV